MSFQDSSENISTSHPVTAVGMDNKQNELKTREEMQQYRKIVHTVILWCFLLQQLHKNTAQTVTCECKMYAKTCT